MLLKEIHFHICHHFYHIQNGYHPVAAVNINVPISYEICLIESPFWCQCIDKLGAISNLLNVVHLTFMNLHSQHYIKWRMSNRIAYIFKKKIFGRTGRRKPLLKYMYFWGAISTILLLTLTDVHIRHFTRWWPSILIITILSCKLYHLRAIYLYQNIRMWTGFLCNETFCI